jgi:hypothetical protein
MSLFNSLKVSEILNQYIGNGKCIKFWWQFNSVQDVLCLLYSDNNFAVMLWVCCCPSLVEFENLNSFLFNVILLYFGKMLILMKFLFVNTEKSFFFGNGFKKKSQNCEISHIWKVYSVFSSFFYAFEMLMTRASGSIPMNFLFQVKFDCSKTCAGGSPCHLALILSCCVSHLWPFFWYSVNDFVFLFI